LHSHLNKKLGKGKPGRVTPNPSYSQGGYRETVVLDEPRQKYRDYLKNKLKAEELGGRDSSGRALA
jgi:hypothetical protein